MTRFTLDDTIAAISTPAGEGGIGIVRLSGPVVREIAAVIFVPARRGQGMPPRRLVLGRVVDEAGAPLDEVLLAYMPAPHTYTRQDVVEINCHGGVVATRRVLEACLRRGVRSAGPGEFTLRAFLNGRIDLAQAEAVLDAVRARTDAGLQIAVSQLAGSLSARVRAVRESLLQAQAHVVASIDFPEDEIPALDLPAALRDVAAGIDRLLATADSGIVYRQGVRAAIVGRPNVGKSSLLNALLRTARAIVTSIPGTTRDTVEETLNLQGVPVVLVDTAGLDRVPRDQIDELGMERSRAAVAAADMVLTVLDGSEALREADREALGLAAGRPAILVINKVDLPARLDTGELPASIPQIHVSAETGDGLPWLENAMLDLILGGKVAAGEGPAVSNPRHKAALERARESVGAALAAEAAGLPADCISIDLAEALDALGEITGETAGEDLLDRIFADFCIGK